MTMRPLVGRVVEKVESRGKWLLIYFSGDLILVTHMLMSGSWHLYRTGERWQMGRGRMRVVIRTAEWEAVALQRADCGVSYGAVAGEKQPDAEAGAGYFGG